MKDAFTITGKLLQKVSSHRETQNHPRNVCKLIPMPNSAHVERNCLSIVKKWQDCKASAFSLRLVCGRISHSSRATRVCGIAFFCARRWHHCELARGKEVNDSQPLQPVSYCNYAYLETAKCAKRVFSKARRFVTASGVPYVTIFWFMKLYRTENTKQGEDATHL